MSNLMPLGDNLVVEPTTKEAQTASGIYIPDTASKEKPQEGVVVAVGPGRKADDGSVIAMEVAVGDKVLFKKYAPDEFEVEGKKVLVLRESDVIAKIS